MWLQVQRGHLFIRHFESRGIFGCDPPRLHAQTRLGLRLTNVVECQVERTQWASSPGLADLAEQPMFNRIPFGGAGRIVTDRDGQAEAIRYLLWQLLFPDATTCAIAPAPIGCNH